MRSQYGILVALVLIALTIISGCACGSKISADEAIAVVQQSETLHDYPIFLPYPPSMGEWSASYEGKGHWVVTCVFDERGEPWNEPDGFILKYHYDYYENSGIVQFKDVDVIEP